MLQIQPPELTHYSPALKADIIRKYKKGDGARVRKEDAYKGCGGRSLCSGKMNSGPVPRAELWRALSVVGHFPAHFSLIFCWRNDGFRCYPCSHGRPIPPVEDQHRYAVLRSSRGVHSQIRLPSQSLVWGVHAREARANLFVFRSRTVLRLFVHLHAPFCQRLCRRLEGIFIGSLGVKLC